jgi:hypothetical protein
MRPASVTFALVFLLQSQTASSAWTPTGFVTNVWSHNGYHIIDTTITDNLCGMAGRFWWLASDAEAKEMFALAVAALASDKQISVGYDGTSCLLDGQLVTHMRIAR